MKKIAIIGSGIAGNTAAYYLNPHFNIELFEAEGRTGGHANTVQVSKNGRLHDIDTGFIVFNELTYPGLTQLFMELGVESTETDMGFAVHDRMRDFEYSTSSLKGLIACRKNIFQPSFWRIWIDFIQFKKLAKKILLNPDDYEGWTLEYTLSQQSWKYSQRFRDDFLFPLAAAIWSMPEGDIAGYPVVAILRFLMNHHMLDMTGQPIWRTVKGGSRQYVDKLTASFKHKIHVQSPIKKVIRHADHVVLQTASGEEAYFDEVIFATHSNETLAMIENPHPLEKELLGDIQYTDSEAILHTDTSVLAKRRQARSSWNVDISPNQDSTVRVSYDMNQLQHIESEDTFCVSLNMRDQIRPECIHYIKSYSHPFFDKKAVKAQSRWHEISGVDRLHFCGAYWRWGFHEDGLWSAKRVVDQLVQREARLRVQK